MADGDRPIPPGESRVAAAGWAGLFARSRSFVSGLTLLGFGAALQADWPPAFASAWLRRSVLGAVNTRQGAADAAIAATKSLLLATAAIAVPALVAWIAGAALPSLLARRKRGQTSAPLPEQPDLGAARFPFFAIAFGLFVLLAVRGLREHLSGVLLSSIAGPEAIRMLISIAGSLFLSAGAALALLGFFELLLLRQRLWRELHLAPAEAKRDLRVSFGNPEMRSRVRQFGERKPP